jgi:hypothetical protein
MPETGTGGRASSADPAPTPAAHQGATGNAAGNAAGNPRAQPTEPTSADAPIPRRPSSLAALADLIEDPRPAVSRAAFAARYPSWGMATLSLLVVGLLVGFASLRPLGEAINRCAGQPGLLVCRSAMHPVVVALPVAALLAGLTTSLLAGRQLARRGRTPLLAASVGWVVFVLGTLLAYLLSAAG